MAKFQKGHSGNPLGRPKDPFRALIREKTGDGYILVETVFGLLESKDESMRLKSVEWLADRGWGKAAQLVEVSGDIAGRIVLVRAEPEKK